MDKDNIVNEDNSEEDESMHIRSTDTSNTASGNVEKHPVTAVSASDASSESSPMSKDINIRVNYIDNNLADLHEDSSPIQDALGFSSINRKSDNNYKLPSESKENLKECEKTILSCNISPRIPESEINVVCTEVEKIQVNDTVGFSTMPVHENLSTCNINEPITDGDKTKSTCNGSFPSDVKLDQASNSLPRHRFAWKSRTDKYNENRSLLFSEDSEEDSAETNCSKFTTEVEPCEKDTKTPVEQNDFKMTVKPIHVSSTFSITSTSSSQMNSNTSFSDAFLKPVEWPSSPFSSNGLFCSNKLENPQPDLCNQLPNTQTGFFLGASPGLTSLKTSFQNTGDKTKVSFSFPSNSELNFSFGINNAFSNMPASKNTFHVKPDIPKSDASSHQSAVSNMKVGDKLLSDSKLPESRHTLLPLQISTNNSEIGLFQPSCRSRDCSDSTLKLHSSGSITPQSPSFTFGSASSESGESALSSFKFWQPDLQNTENKNASLSFDLPGDFTSGQKLSSSSSALSHNTSSAFETPATNSTVFSQNTQKENETDLENLMKNNSSTQEDTSGISASANKGTSVSENSIPSQVSLFGSNTKLFGSTNTTPVFGGTNATSKFSLFGTVGTSSFGASNASSLSGTSNSTSIFGNPNTESKFGTSNAKSLFGNTNSFFNHGSSIFNLGSSSSLPENSNAIPLSGKSNFKEVFESVPHFQNSTTAPLFGNSTSTSVFGNNTGFVGFTKLTPLFGSSSTDSVFKNPNLFSKLETPENDKKANNPPKCSNVGGGTKQENEQFSFKPVVTTRSENTGFPFSTQNTPSAGFAFGTSTANGFNSTASTPGSVFSFSNPKPRSKTQGKYNLVRNKSRIQSTPVKSQIPFRVVKDKDTYASYGVTKSIEVRHQHITAMPEYSSMSFEELRCQHERYSVGNTEELKSSVNKVNKKTQTDASALEEENHLTDIWKVLECPVCLEIVSPPIQQCEQGHHVCNNCWKEVPSCPLCRRYRSHARNYVAESMVEKLPLPCKYRVEGCMKTVRQKNKAEHEEGCPYRTYSCLIDGCNQALSFKDMVIHLKASHGQLVSGTEFCIPQGPKFSWNLNKHTFHKVIHTFDIPEWGLFFLRHRESGQNNCLWMQVLSVGSSDAEFSYSVEAADIKELRSVTYKGPVLPLHTTVSDRQDCLIIANDLLNTLKSYCGLHIKISIWKNPSRMTT